MTKQSANATPQCAAVKCTRPLSRAATGRPSLYCSQACRQAALRERRSTEQAPALRAEAAALLALLALLAPRAPVHHLDGLTGEQLAHLVRHVRAVLDLLTLTPHPGPAARHEPVQLPPDRHGRAPWAVLDLGTGLWSTTDRKVDLFVTKDSALVFIRRRLKHPGQTRAFDD
ncbi:MULTISPECIES: hypothetical protein [Kitasatospora]|uniref:hypothetical protein n=1 Tax=Kitasatospora TaxID=2063 RepID=UPI0011D2681F|nr:hypothetical protein [Kitasatospora setae]